MGATIIHKGAKLDNLIQIAHNVEVGENTVIAAQTGVAGSTKIGSWCMIGGQVGVAGHTHIGNNVNIGAQSGIMSDVKDGVQLIGTPATEPRAYFKMAALQRRLPDMRKEIDSLQKEIKELKELLNK